MNNKILPIGTLVYLDEGTSLMAIIGIGQLIKQNEADEKPTYFDYVGVIYPQGLVSEELYYFNQDNISEVVRESLVNEQHERLIVAMEEWKKDNADQFIKGKIVSCINRIRSVDNKAPCIHRSLQMETKEIENNNWNVINIFRLNNIKNYCVV
ncbi:DUF4176 domain-containing protein [Latilactobacillus graminis]|nr:DUF4176 domain-containing protein [Latilactobacillus graminis]